MKIFNSFTLKIIAIATMLMDHIYTFLSPLGVDVPIWFGYLGKLAAPIFFYLIVEGFFHTRNRWKYLSRLSVFGAGMIIVDSILGITNNVFLSLALAILLLTTIEAVKKSESVARKIVLTLACIVMGFSFIFTEASIFGLVMTLTFYFLRDRKILMTLVYSAFALFPVISAIGTPEMYNQIFLYDYQWMMVFAIPFILMYNGKLGPKNTFTKWMFYAFYPAHLIIVNIIAGMIA